MKNWPNEYKVLKGFKSIRKNDFELIPIRYEDRYEIMDWRNDQIYHLRQKEILTKDIQDDYFNDVIKLLFKDRKPKQILFSFLKENLLIGYGGLVHINWENKNSEISFILNTTLEEKKFEMLWDNFLSLLENVAFSKLGLHKIYTYAFDLRPRLYVVLEKRDYKQEARLKMHEKFKNEFIDVLIHSKFNVNGNN
ncbi:GNAT family N-acetyltransferase [Flavobacteriaceae bacterium]|nr:GNAT family N-acetyltransferase [Flavobacteriaceae bacterium]